MATNRRGKHRPKSSKALDTHPNAQIIVAQDGVKQARRAVFVAWIGVVMNTAVIGTALLVPALQRSWSEYDKAVESKEQDKLALMGGYSRLVETSMILSSEALLDIEACPSLRKPTKVDIARIAGINRRMAALNQTIFLNGAKSPIQTDVQAGMIRLYDGIEDALHFVQNGPTSELTNDQKIGFCNQVITEVILQSEIVKSQLIYDYRSYMKPIPSPYPFAWPTPTVPIITEQQETLLKSLESIELPTKNDTAPAS